MNKLPPHRICPLCGGDNHCRGDAHCFCMNITIPRGLLEKVPLDKRGKACICQQCIEKYRKENSHANEKTQ